MRDGVPLQVSSGAAVEIPICVYQPIVHKGVNGRFLAGLATDGLHIFGDWFAAYGFGKDGDFVFEGETVATLAN